MLVGIKITTVLDPKPVERAADKATFNSLSHAAASIRKDTAESIQIARGASEPGTPPHTHIGGRKKGTGKKGLKNRNAAMKKAVAYFVDRENQEAIIGYKESSLGAIANLHEFGGWYKGGDYPERPSIGPALERAAPRLAGLWEGEIGG